MRRPAVADDGHGVRLGACDFVARPIRLAGMSAADWSKPVPPVIQPSLEDLLEEEDTVQDCDTRRKEPKTERLRGAEQALDAVRRKYGDDIASFGI